MASAIPVSHNKLAPAPVLPGDGPSQISQDPLPVIPEPPVAVPEGAPEIHTDLQGRRFRRYQRDFAGRIFFEDIYE